MGLDPVRGFRFLIDENVQAGVSSPIESLGYTVYDSRAELTAGAADETLARLAELQDLILVSHDRDFRGLLRQTAVLSRRQVRQVPLLQLGVTYPRSMARTRQCWPLVEHYLGYAWDNGLALSRIVLLEREVEVRYRLEPGDPPV